MRTFTKIILLILFAICAVAGVLLFAKEQAAPPKYEKSEPSQFEQKLNDLTSVMEKSETFSEAEENYANFLAFSQRFLSEDFIDATIADHYHKPNGQMFGSQLSKYVFDKLGNKWNDYDFYQLEFYVSWHANSDVLESGEKAASEEFLAEAQRFYEVMVDYNAAVELSNDTYYRGIEDARERINKANEYRQHEYLKNNSELSEKLTSLPGRIGLSHFERLKKGVEECLKQIIAKAQDKTIEFDFNTWKQKQQELDKELYAYREKCMALYGKDEGIGEVQEDFKMAYDIEQALKSRKTNI